MTIWIENLKRLVALVDIKLAEEKAETGEFDSRNYTAWRARHDAAVEKVKAFFTEEEDARFTERPPHDHAVKMAGILASSTSGFTSALGNWRTAALKKITADDGFNPHGSGPVPIEPREG